MKSHYLPIVLFFDFEARQTLIKNNEGQYVQEPIMYTLIAIDLDGRIVRPIEQYAGNDSAVHFLLRLLEMTDELTKLCQQHRNFKPTAADIEMRRKAQVCYICKMTLLPNHKQAVTPYEKRIQRVLDHDHYSNRVLGVACSHCNCRRIAQQK